MNGRTKFVAALMLASSLWSVASAAPPEPVASSEAVAVSTPDPSAPSLSHDGPGAWTVGSLLAEARLAREQGRLGEATLATRRAATLAPWDPEVRATARALDPSASPTTGRLATIGPWGWSGIAAGAAALLLLWTVVSLVREPGDRKRLPVGAALGVVMGLAVFAGRMTTPAADAAIVVRAAELHTGPGAGDSLGVLPEATEVSLVRVHGDAAFVQAPSGRRGWIPVRAVEAILPPPLGG